MSDRARRTMCRLLFAAACLLPTCIVLSWILNPTSTSEWESQVKQQLGIAIRVASVHTPLPQTTILNDVQLPLVGENEPVELGTVSISNKEAFRQISFDSLELKSHWFAQLTRQIHRHVAAEARPNRVHQLNIAATEIICQTHERALVKFGLFDIAARLVPKHNSVELNVRFRLSPDSDTSPISVLYVRRDNSSLADTGSENMDSQTLPSESWTVDCRDSEISLLLLSELIPNAKSFGDAASFQGFVNLEKRGDSWNGTATGSIKQADLMRLVFDPFGQFLSGTVDIEIADCKIFQSKIARLEGTLTCQSGFMGAHFFSSLRTGFNWSKPQLLDEIQTRIALDTRLDFQDAGIHFLIESGKLRFKELNGRDRLLSFDAFEGPLLVSNWSNIYPVESLIQVLAGNLQAAFPISAYTMTQSIQMQSNQARSDSIGNDVLLRTQTPRVGARQSPNPVNHQR